MKEIVGFACDWCLAKDFNKFGMYKHEIYCGFNPANKSCNSCKHLAANKSGYGGRTKCTKLDIAFKGSLQINCEDWELQNE
jgi:hypothetical protein